jgi:hypothetical protein
MKTVKYKFLLLLIVSLYMGCEIDNYDAPNGGLYGQIIDAATGEPVQQPVPSEQGLRLRFYEAGKENSREQHFYAQMDGSYRNSHIFNGPIRLVLEQRNFFPVDTIDILVNGQTGKDIKVIPYTRIQVEGMEWKDTVSVRFTLYREKNRSYEKHKLMQYCILWHASPYVDNQMVNHTGKISQILDTIPDDEILDSHYSIGLNLSVEANRELLKSKMPLIKGNGNLIYFRIAVITAETLETINRDGSLSISRISYTNYSQVYPLQIPLNFF